MLKLDVNRGEFLKIAAGPAPPWPANFRTSCHVVRSGAYLRNRDASLGLTRWVDGNPHPLHRAPLQVAT